MDIGVILDNIRHDVIWPLFAGLAVIMFIYAGILFLTAAGEPGKITKAKDAVIWAIIGIIVGIAAYGAVGLISNIVTKGG